LHDTIFYKPEDDPMGLKHVALLIVAQLNFAPLCCVRRTVNNKLLCWHNGMENPQFKQQNQLSLFPSKWKTGVSQDTL